MQTEHHRPPSRTSVRTGSPVGSRWKVSAQLAPASAEDGRFIELLNGYRSSGGLQRLAFLRAARRDAWATEVLGALAAGVADRRILGIAWNQDIWVPGFQFDDSGAVQPATRAVLLELTSTHDPWDLAAWFISPSNWLRQSRPIDLLGMAPARVIEAARADRYVATGN